MAKIVYEAADGTTEREAPHFEYNGRLNSFQVEVNEAEGLFHEIPRERVYHIEWAENDETPFQRVGEA